LAVQTSHIVERAISPFLDLLVVCSRAPESYPLATKKDRCGSARQELIEVNTDSEVVAFTQMEFTPICLKAEEQENEIDNKCTF